MKSISPTVDNLLQSYTHQNVGEALELLIKLLANIEANPLDVKYRKINSGNKTLAAKVFALRGIENILTSIGFTLQGEFYAFTSQSIAPVSQALIILRARHLGLSAVRTGEMSTAEKERMLELQAQQRAQEEERKRLLGSMNNDKKDQKDREKDRVYKDSNANKLTFGASIMEAKNVCTQPRG